MLAIHEGRIQKDKKKPQGAKGKNKGKNKLAYAPKAKIPSPPKRDNLVKDSIFYHCKEVGHWRRNCPSYHAELKKRKNASVASTSSIFTIELYAFPNKTWVYDTGYAHKPFQHQVERAKDLLGLIHTDVCGPFRTVSREGANYFITFIDDFSRYGFVYSMKDKHEVFESFKVFQNEVENQLGKKIKAIRSDRVGEYLSHEFVNHMKSYGIVSQLTPPYTPQHNGVSERRNQNLLDMVQSMMNLTTLPKSFWRYALETTAPHS
ncbi:retrotransposon protein, putative, ty1-copia subclass [Tanacetum coccineum]